MKIKPGVSIRGIGTEIAVALVVIRSVLLGYGLETVVTSAVDGKHSSGSLHYTGDAVDIRSRDADAGKQARITLELKEALGGEFDVVLEKDHWHIEFQPKRQVS